MKALYLICVFDLLCADELCAGKVEAAKEEDPMLICTAFKRHRFYLFTRREPDSQEYVYFI